MVVQSLSHVQLFMTPLTAAHQASLCFIISQSLFNLMSIESVMPSNHLILCLLFLFLPSIFPSIMVFSNKHSPPDSSVHGILQERILEWIAISFSGKLPNRGFKTRSSTLQMNSLHSGPPGKSQLPITAQKN